MRQQKNLIILLSILGVSVLIPMLVVAFMLRGEGKSGATGTSKTTTTVTPTQTLKVDEQENTSESDYVDLSGDSKDETDESRNNESSEDTTTPQNASSTQVDTDYLVALTQQSYDGSKYTVSDVGDKIVDADGNVFFTVDSQFKLKKFHIVNNSTIYAILQKQDEPRHFYLKRINPNSGAGITMWHYISAYDMVDFAVKPGSNVFYVLFAKSDGILILKIENYKLVAQKTEALTNDGNVSWRKVKDKEEFEIIYSDGSSQKNTKIVSLEGEAQ